MDERQNAADEARLRAEEDQVMETCSRCRGAGKHGVAPGSLKGTCSKCNGSGTQANTCQCGTPECTQLGGRCCHTGTICGGGWHDASNTATSEATDKLCMRCLMEKTCVDVASLPRLDGKGACCTNCKGHVKILFPWPQPVCKKIMQVSRVGTVLHLLSLGGNNVCELDWDAQETLSNFKRRLSKSLGTTDDTSFDVAFESGVLLSDEVFKNPNSKLYTLLNPGKTLLSI